MKKVIKQWLALTLAIGALVSCSDDRNEPSSTAEGGGETVTLSLSAEVSVDDADLRAINYKLGTNAKGQLVPLPEFTDGQLVDVHTIVKSSTGATAAKTLKWRYDATSKKLVLSQSDGHDITVSGFNNDGGVKWYISGMIGGTLTVSTRKVSFEGTRELRGVEGNVGDIVGNLNVPYAFGWTELIVNSSSERNSQNSHKYAQILSTSNVKFEPLGSLIAFKLGNAQKAGAYTFTPSGFIVNSNVFGDKGTFDLNTALPDNSTSRVLPAWTEGEPSVLVYNFSDGHTPGTIAHGEMSDKTYYAWVMPHKTQPTSVITRVVMKGESSRPEVDGFRDYTKTWFTDYRVKTSQLTQGRVHPLKANATHTYRLPIEYVTDYNLAGGEGLTLTIKSGTTVGHLGSPALGGVQPSGVTGPLRFANFNADGTENNHGHRNDMSGYYVDHKIVGLEHATYNPGPDPKNLQVEVDRAFGADKYFIPTMEHWSGVFPVYPVQISPNSSTRNYSTEPMSFGPGHDLISQIYHSDYSRPVSTNAADPNALTSDAVTYGIRFQKFPPNRIVSSPTSSVKTDGIPKAIDNSLKCAYRYTRVGGYTSYRTSDNINLTNQLVIDVVYLGEEAVPTQLNDISSPEWWNKKKDENLVITKIFPTAGFIGSNNVLYMRGGNLFAASTRFSDSRIISAYTNYTIVSSYASTYLGSPSTATGVGVPVRLFARLND